MRGGCQRGCCCCCQACADACWLCRCGGPGGAGFTASDPGIAAALLVGPTPCAPVYRASMFSMLLLSCPGSSVEPVILLSLVVQPCQCSHDGGAGASAHHSLSACLHRQPSPFRARQHHVPR